MAIIVSYVADEKIEPLLRVHLATIGTTQAARSVQARRLWILRIARALGQPVATATYGQLLNWQVGLEGKSKPTKAAALSHLTGYMTWLVKYGHRADNPAADLTRPKNAYAKDPHPISEDHLALALANADPIMRAWLQLGAYCGLRCMEIAAVQRTDILPGDPTRLLIHGKGDKERKVRLPSELHRELQSGIFPERGHLWRDGLAPFTPAKVSRLIGVHMRNLGIDATAHALRHRFGTELYRVTRDVVRVRDAMGHSSIETTMCYVRAVGDSATDDAVETISRPRLAA